MFFILLGRAIFKSIRVLEMTFVLRLVSSNSILKIEMSFKRSWIIEFRNLLHPWLRNCRSVIPTDHFSIQRYILKFINNFGPDFEPMTKEIQNNIKIYQKNPICVDIECNYLII
ncbi:hypothetical protein BpHYR1_013676 [Brachionus plicatilis]|uniref:Uncharacterized protein n=1 Tax=Brachionus plicatilis TaxID=10195 RepID=A0A3M7SXI5_BRAPC|nr:hypothetical protein BpHYR1_013676 [Brachionus plicatilis]